MAKIGVFVCHCGENIGSRVDCEKLTEAMNNHPGVSVSVQYKYFCSDPGQENVKKAIRENNLTGIVVAACSPKMHEATFRKACAEAGLNPYLCEIANIREQCSWVHSDKDMATEKAIEITRSLIEKVKLNNELQPIEVPVTRRALVIGGGIAGIQAALDIANAGREVVLVEREASLGGHMSQLSETFPTLDCSQCIMTPRMVEAAQHPKIRLLTYAEVEQVDGYIGNFNVKVRLKARYVDMKSCTGCGDCMLKCPVKKISSEFECGLGKRTAIYTPFAQAVPNIPVIDKKNCIYFKNGKCKQCAAVCELNAIDFEMQDEIINLEIGAIVVATGFQVQNTAMYGEYGYGKYPDVITGLQFERLASASGPSDGKILRPSDGKEPRTIVFIQCAGSRDPSKGVRYCSKICCMYTAKHAMLYAHKVHGSKTRIFYMDIRAAGKGYDEFTRRAIEEDEAGYVRGRVSKVWRENDKLMVRGVDTLLGRPMEIAADMVVLATAMVPQPDAKDFAKVIGITYDEYGFYNEAHLKLRPVETTKAGIFLAGACQSPKDIPDSVAQASAAASKVLGLFSRDQLEREPVIAENNENTCSGCWGCVLACPYNAIEKKDILNRSGELVKQVAFVNPGLCQGCGTCVTFCRSNSIDLAGFTERQIFAEVMGL
ncbi:CoB--CoM heterodisulfide reductase iron-sulfur subunit A family protein [Chlorobium phaeobacteroides]|jgi:heterodisulfide reductase subunit A|uniref:4Fe-4S ferredoxin, iron-sulfur binding domain protein n=1 Tax=Chlorobium phaeobacteroides (strain DSM 266 / SMG 266 / 2430) TaxID=290317 RepID=A1BFW6_CHLPD|nr:CoB--CoM heterodisulfide reductase iron-sulfur subunit A family protein [Chlorobium phaeobacteroides]ABL65293.1 4Fe-4S ferredoxin, iron-sulfur binding domain protein [Chlorobium phaeobacteroides DSM 266]MBV5327873.1 CoB--CoM heterodisulfide reductase iron-sulfur subunit A family protein [Chlorobium sp.]